MIQMAAALSRIPTGIAEGFAVSIIKEAQISFPLEFGLKPLRNRNLFSPVFGFRLG